MTKAELRRHIFNFMGEHDLNYTNIALKMGVTRSAVQSAMTNKSVTYDKLFEICDVIGLKWYVKFEIHQKENT